MKCFLFPLIFQSLSMHTFTEHILYWYLDILESTVLHFFRFAVASVVSPFLLQPRSSALTALQGSLPLLPVHTVFIINTRKRMLCHLYLKSGTLWFTFVWFLNFLPIDAARNYFVPIYNTSTPYDNLYKWNHSSQKKKITMLQKTITHTPTTTYT